jgi:hypothetical protein
MTIHTYTRGKRPTERKKGVGRKENGKEERRKENAKHKMDNIDNQV